MREMSPFFAAFVEMLVPGCADEAQNAENRKPCAKASPEKPEHVGTGVSPVQAMRSIARPASLIAAVTLTLAAFAQHPADHKHATVASRGNQAMGFDQQKTTHSFSATPSGGVIRVSARDGADTASIKQIRSHLKEIAAAFKAGDFAKPAFIHDKNPPGAETLRKLRKQIDYLYAEAPDGALITIATKNAEARKAVVDFFRMQITEHKTGDPLPQ